MVKKKNLATAASSVSGGAAAKASSNLPKRSAPYAPPPAPAPPAPPSSVAVTNPGDWLASSITKRGEKRSRSLGLVSSDEGNTPIASGNLHDLPDDTSEGGGSSTLDKFHTVENIISKDEHDDPIDSEAAFINPPPPANDTCDTAGSVHDEEVDHDTFVNAAVEVARASPAKISTGGFADEDDLFELDEGFIEPPSKKAKSGAAPPTVAASEASAPTAAPAAQVSTASSISRGKDIPSTASATTPPSGKPDLRTVISSLETFASQFTSLEADKARLQKEVKSSSSKLEEAADIPADALDKLPNNSPANGVSMTLASHQLTVDA
nr:uncharacterized protein LOC127319536 [Lolium perenne]